jgi:hypothetical protein
VKKAWKNEMFFRKNGQKAGEKESLYFNSERWNADLNGGFWEVSFLTAQIEE